MNDDRITRHLSDQADAITLSPADPGEAIRRGNRRRTRRRTGLVGAVAVVGLLATSVALRDTDDQSVDSIPTANAIESTFDWSVVTPASGLGYGSNSAQLADGSVYSISTAPGAGVDADPSSVLYRSTDGAEWSPASLPSGLRTSALAGGGDTLYSVGTSPAGGLVVSTSSDGAESWSGIELPDDTAGVAARHPGQISLGSARVAARDADHAVATIVATTSSDPAAFGHPEYTYEGYQWTWDESGLHVYEAPESECAPVPTTVVDAEGTDPANLDAAGGPVDMACRAQAPAKGEGEGPEAGKHVADHSYEDLGITGELRDHVGGKTYAYVTDDGETFSAADLPDVGSGLGYLSDVVSTDAGYRLLAATSDGSGTQVLGSADGTSWSVLTELPGTPGQLGVLNGRAALSLWGNQDGSSSLRLEQADGTWSTVDLLSAVGGADKATYLGELAFGPLGLAAVVGSSDGDDHQEVVVHSADGVNLQVIDLDSLVDTGGAVSGLTVTADAIAARVTTPDDGNPSTPPSQKVLVGTPG